MRETRPLPNNWLTLAGFQIIIRFFLSFRQPSMLCCQSRVYSIQVYCLPTIWVLLLALGFLTPSRHDVATVKMPRRTNRAQKISQTQDCPVMPMKADFRYPWPNQPMIE